MIKIEDGVPIPPRRKGRPPLAKWPFADLQIGQSFASRQKRPIESTMRMYAYKAAREFGRKFLVMTVIEDNMTLIRVWRTK